MNERTNETWSAVTRLATRVAGAATLLSASISRLAGVMSSSHSSSETTSPSVSTTNSEVSESLICGGATAVSQSTAARCSHTCNVTYNSHSSASHLPVSYNAFIPKSPLIQRFTFIYTLYTQLFFTCLYDLAPLQLCNENELIHYIAANLVINAQKQNHLT